MDNSPYLTLVHGELQNFLLQSTEETLELQDHNLKSGNIFNEIEDVAKEWSVELPVLMEDQDIEETPIELASTNNTSLELVRNLPGIYEETLAHPCDVVLETVPNGEAAGERQITYPIEVPGKGFITTEGFLISNDLLLQLEFSNNEGLTVTTNDDDEQMCTNADEIVLPRVTHSVANLKSLLVSKQAGQENSVVLSTIVPQTHLNSNTCKPNSSECTPKNKSYKNLYDVVSAHKCKLCGFLTEEQNIIIQHCKLRHFDEEAPKNGHVKPEKDLKVRSIIKNGQAKMIYICSICKHGFSSTEKLKLHMILSHKLASVPEEIDSKELVNAEVNDAKPPLKLEEKKKLQMSILRQQAKASKKIKCSITGCDLRFALEEMRARHEKCHIEGQKQFKCSECNFRFSSWRTCSVHLWRCHSLDLGLFTCPMCHSFKASSTVRLVNHMAIHEEDRPYKCRLCEKRFKQHSQMINHQIMHKDSNIVPEWASQQQCEICKKYFSNSKTLKKHVQGVHDKFKPFICVVCGHKTTRKSMLELHSRQHTGEKPHQCPICEYKTGDHNSLRRHVMRHSGNTKYACPHCAYQSIQSTAYKNHVATRHPGLGGSYFCSLCSYHTVNEITYRAHLADHEKGLITETTDDTSNEFLATRDEVNGNDERAAKKLCDVEDDESHNYLSLLEHSNDAVDTGGITIPAGFEMPE